MRPTWSHWLDQIAERWATWMVSMSWEVVVLLLVLGLVTLLTRRGSARLRHAIWLLVFVRLIVPPDLAIPTGIAWWLRSPMEPVVPSANPEGLDNGGQVVVSDGRAAVAPKSIQPSDTTSVARPFATILFLAWAGVLAARCGMLFTAWLQVRSWVVQSRPIDMAKLSRPWERARARAGVERAIDLRDSDACVTPLVVGVLRPTILLPSAIVSSLDTDEMESILVHELMHVRRGDGWVRLAQAILQSVYFFHPAVWLAAAVERQLREEACDEATVNALDGRRKPYASALVKTVANVGYSAPALALGLRNSPRLVRQRMQRILDTSLSLHSSPTWCIVTIQVLLAALFLPSGARTEPLRSITKSLPANVQVTEANSAAPRDNPQVDDVADKQTKQFEIPGSDDERAAELTADWHMWVHRIADPAQRSAAISTLIAAGPAAEIEVMRLLNHEDEACRFAAYEILEKIGTHPSLPLLQDRFLQVSGREQDAAKRALDSVWQRTRDVPFSTPFQTQNPRRISD